MSYRLALLSTIPLVRTNGGHRSVGLWVRDLEGQVGAIAGLVLFSPVLDAVPAGWDDAQPLPDGIEVVDVDRLDAHTLRDRLAGCDLVQLPGNFTWRRSATARRFLRTARRLGKPVITGISSDRAKTAVLNAARASLLRRLRARLEALSIRVSQSHLVGRSNAAFVVGDGLRRLVEPWNDVVHVGTASWIRLSDIRPARAEPAAGSPWQLCIAARLERMKGVHVGIEAVGAMQAGGGPAVRLTVAGVGPEDAALREQARSAAGEAGVRFVGSLGYPDPFFALLREMDVVVVTNLNDEQPRIVFDAISQGCLVVCPDSVPFRGLGLPDALRYRRGDAHALAACLQQLVERPDRLALRASLAAIARAATIETMHARRREWIESRVLRRPGAPRAIGAAGDRRA